VKIKPFIKSIMNIARIGLRLDENRQIENWAKIGEKTELKPVQIDGFFKKHEELKPLIEWNLAFLRDQIDKNLKSGRVLDYGCGTGRYLEEIAKLNRYKLFGIDGSKPILENFTKKRNLDVTLACLSLDRDKQYSGDHRDYFDGVYTINMIQLIRPSSFWGILKSLISMLKKNGPLIINFPHPNSVWDIMSDIKFMRYSPICLERFLKKKGIEIIHSGTASDNRRVRYVDSSGKPNYGYWIVGIKRT